MLKCIWSRPRAHYSYTQSTAGGNPSMLIFGIVRFKIPLRLLIVNLKAQWCLHQFRWSICDNWSIKSQWAGSWLIRGRVPWRRWTLVFTTWTGTTTTISGWKTSASPWPGPWRRSSEARQGGRPHKTELWDSPGAPAAPWHRSSFAWPGFSLQRNRERIW